MHCPQQVCLGFVNWGLWLPLWSQPISYVIFLFSCSIQPFLQHSTFPNQSCILIMCPKYDCLIKLGYQKDPTLALFVYLKSCTHVKGILSSSEIHRGLLLVPPIREEHLVRTNKWVFLVTAAGYGIPSLVMLGWYPPWCSSSRRKAGRDLLMLWTILSPSNDGWDGQTDDV